MNTLMLSSRQVAASSGKTAGRHERALLASTVLAALFAWPVSVPAQEAAALAGAPTALGDVQTVQPSPTNRHVELRRALLSDEDADGGIRERRQLTPQERAELHRRLRDALRNAYGERIRAQQIAPSP